MQSVVHGHSERNGFTQQQCIAITERQRHGHQNNFRNSIVITDADDDLHVSPSFASAT